MDRLPEDKFAVRVENLVKRYKNGTNATRGIDLSVPRGESIAVLGPNGAGKTTFLRQLTTELKPTSGSINIFGIDAIREPRRAKLIMGVTPQEAGLFETLSVREHLQLFGRLKGLDRSQTRDQTTELLETLELEKIDNKQVGTLSGGQRRRILIGLAMLGKPGLLILDEPTTGLDPDARQLTWRLLMRIVERGTTLIFSTHYLEEAAQLGRRIVFIAAGKIVADGTLADLRSRVPQEFRPQYPVSNGEIGGSHVENFAIAAHRNYPSSKPMRDYRFATTPLEELYFSLNGYRDGDEEGEGC